MLGASSGSARIVECVLEEDPLVNTKDKAGWTALMHAASGDHREVVEVLLARTNTDLEATNCHGQTAGDLTTCPILKGLLRVSGGPGLPAPSSASAPAPPRPKDPRPRPARHGPVPSTPSPVGAPPDPHPPPPAQVGGGATKDWPCVATCVRSYGWSKPDPKLTLCNVHPPGPRSGARPA
jgi:ankyrin repeat protein